MSPRIKQRLTGYKAADLARLGASARRQIELARMAFSARDRLNAAEVEAAIKAGAKPSKYGNKRVHLDGQWFDSKAEADRYGQLKVLQRIGRISELICQPEFPIAVNGHVICRYIADFQYTDDEGRQIIEDVKSKPTKTPVYRLKKKLMLAVLGITITEV